MSKCHIRSSSARTPWIPSNISVRSGRSRVEIIPAPRRSGPLPSTSRTPGITRCPVKWLVDCHGLKPGDAFTRAQARECGIRAGTADIYAGVASESAGSPSAIAYGSRSVASFASPCDAIPSDTGRSSETSPRPATRPRPAGNDPSGLLDLDDCDSFGVTARSHRP
jgi:hypothetical protein